MIFYSKHSKIRDPGASGPANFKKSGTRSDPLKSENPGPVRTRKAGPGQLWLKTLFSIRRNSFFF